MDFSTAFFYKDTILLAENIFCDRIEIMQYSKGHNFVIIMVVIAVSALILRFAIEELLKINITQNESNASGTLKLISTALENYAQAHSGTYPASLSLLTQDNPPYLEKDYVALSPIRGYNFNCFRLEASSYSCAATPIKCRLTGKINYTITTGGLLISEECSGKE